MKQPRSRSHVPKTPLEILSEPSCAKCGGRTRFVGLETDPKERAADLCTYECIVCEHVQVATVPRINGTSRADGRHV